MVRTTHSLSYTFDGHLVIKSLFRSVLSNDMNRLILMRNYGNVITPIVGNDSNYECIWMFINEFILKWVWRLWLYAYLSIRRYPEGKAILSTPCEKLISVLNLQLIFSSKVMKQQIVRQSIDHSNQLRELTQALEVVRQSLVIAGEVQQADKLQRISAKHAMALWSKQLKRVNNYIRQSWHTRWKGVAVWSLPKNS